jgi:putative transcriptional regulator
MTKYKSNSINFESLAGKMLVANPYCSFGDIFDKSIIYIATHTEDGALGLIVNKSISKLGLKKLYRINDNSLSDMEKSILIGGPVEPERSFVLHTGEYSKNITFAKNGEIAVSSNLEVIRDILGGKGPVKSTIILGYTGWGLGQLEEEIENNYWLIVDADPSLIFSDDNNFKWVSALEKIGVESSYFTSQMGHS